MKLNARIVVLLAASIFCVWAFTIYLTYVASRAFVHEVLAGELIHDTIDAVKFIDHAQSRLETGEVEKAKATLNVLKKYEVDRITYLEGAMRKGWFLSYGANAEKVQEAREFLATIPNNQRQPTR